MFPILFKIGAYKITGYYFFNILGFFTASLFILYIAKKESYDFVSTILYLVFGWSFFIIGAGLYYQLKSFFSSPTNYIKNIKIFTHPLLQGHSFFSGIVFMTVFSFIFSKIFFKKRYGKILSLTFIGVSLFQAIGKLGCFSMGCCYGRPTSFFLGMKFKYLGNSVHPYSGIRIHSTQLYESFFNLLSFIFLFYLFKKKIENRKIIGFYFINYGIIRFLEEYLRNDFGRGYIINTGSPFSSLSIPQFYSFILVIFGIILYQNFFSVKKNKKEKNNE